MLRYLKVGPGIAYLLLRIMTDLLAALPPKPLPAEIRPAPGSGLENTPGLEDDHLDTGQFWSTDDGPSFAEFLDIINPLQHIPVVSTLYRAITGDQIGTGPRVAGGMLFGGPVGALAAGITALFEEASGGDIGDHIVALIDDLTGGNDGGDAENVATEKQNPAAGPQAAANNEIQTGATIQQAAVLAGSALTPAAAQLNRIAVNPGAPMGVAQGILQAKAPASASTAAAATANMPFPARPLAMPFGAPASANARAAAQPILRPAAFNPSAPAQTGQSRESVQPAADRRTITAPQVSDAVVRSRRQQTDLMLAQWAAQQMAQQNNTAAGSATKNENARQDMQATAPSSRAHPMLPPRNASPEWYAQAMDNALSRYRNGASTAAGATPGASLRR